MTKSEQFVYDFMEIFDENGLSLTPKEMYLRAYQEMERLREIKALFLIN